MKSAIAPNWEQLKKTYPCKWVDKLENLFRLGGPFSITPDQLATIQIDPEEHASIKDLSARSLELLQAVSRCSRLQENKFYECPRCHNEIVDLPDNEVCPLDNTHAFTDGSSDGIVIIRSFSRAVPPKRNVRWLLALHGMNTRGAWQEDFNWLVSRTYGYMVPVAIYKYGLVLSGAVLKFRQRAIRDQLIERMKRLKAEIEDIGTVGKPDVIAHSFGTWLLGHALRENKHLEVGRVVLLGSILRPDFPWHELVAEGRVEAVLNHYGTKDVWARIAHFAIPDSGPSGCRGFDFKNSGRVEVRGEERQLLLNIPESGFAHSQFFKVDERTIEEIRAATAEPARSERNVLGHCFAHPWQPFLTSPSENLGELEGIENPSTTWKPWIWPLRGRLVPFLLMLLVLALIWR